MRRDKGGQPYQPDALNVKICEELVLDGLIFPGARVFPTRKVSLELLLANRELMASPELPILTISLRD